MDEKGRLTSGGAARGARLSHAFSRAPFRPASVRRARRGDQHVPRGEERRDVPAAGRGGARLPDRHHRRPRGGAPHLSRRRPRAAAVDRAAPGDRHRRRLDRIHHRPRPDAGAPRVAEVGLRQHLAAILSGTARCAPMHSWPPRRMRARKSRRSPGVRTRALARGLRVVGHGAGAGGDPRGERTVSRRHHARGPRAAAQADGRRGPHVAADARGHQARARAGVARAASRSWPLRWRNCRPARSIRSAARCAWACCTTCWAAPGSATAARPPSSASSSAITSIARTRSASRRWRGLSISRRRHARPGDRATRRMGRACCTRSATRSRTSAITSTAPTSSKTPTCRAFRRRSSGSSPCSCTAAAADCRRWSPRSTTQT